MTTRHHTLTLTLTLTQAGEVLFEQGSTNTSMKDGQRRMFIVLAGAVSLYRESATSKYGVGPLAGKIVPRPGVNPGILERGTSGSGRGTNT